MHIELIDAKRYNHIYDFVPEDVYRNIQKNNTFALAAIAEGYEKIDEGDIVGVLAYSKAPYFEITGAKEVLIESIYVRKEYRGTGIASLLIEELEKGLKAKGNIEGISMNIIFPERRCFAEALEKRGYSRRVDGNRIYSVSISSILKNAELANLRKACSKCKTFSFEKASKTLIHDLNEKFEHEIPKYLRPAGYGGVLQKDLSFIVGEDDEAIAFIASSLYPEGLLYIGGIYSVKENAVMIAALLGSLYEGLTKRKDINRLLFSAATEKGDEFIKHALSGSTEEITLHTVTNFYKKIR